MAIRGVPPGITDPNLRGFLNDIRNALAGVSEKVTRITTSTSSGGSGGGGNPSPTPTPGPSPTPTPTPLPPGTQASVVLSISPVKPLTQSPFILTATVTGTFPTGLVTFLKDNANMGSPVTLANGVATFTATSPKGTYTFLASYSGDANNYSAISNALTVEVGSVWDGPPPDMTSLITEGGIGYITLKWTFPFTGDFDVVEVWGSLTNDRSTATKLGESNGSMFVFVPPDVSKSWYFWTRVRDSEGLFSNWYPNTTAGVKGTAFSLESEIANTQLWKDLGTQLGVDEASIATTSGIVQGPNGLAAQYMVKTDVNGMVAGFGLYNDGNISDFFVRADRFAVGNPATYKGTCSIAGHTTQADCKAAGGTWTWAATNDTNIPFIVYTTTQTITAPDGSGKTLTIQPGVYIKSANVQQAFIGDAQIYGSLKSYSWAASNGPNTYPFNGWQLDKSGSLALYGGSFALYDSYGNPIITSGKIAFNQFRRLILTSSAELFTIAKAPSTAITPSSITLTATLQNISGTVSWAVTSGTYSGSLPNGLTQSISPGSMTTSVVTFAATTTVDGVVYSDSLTLAKVQDGSDSLTMLLTNEAHTVPADTAGNVTDWTGAYTVASVFRGATDVTVSEGWSISVPTYTGVQSPGPFVSGQSVTVNASYPLNANVATITIQAAKSGSATLTRVFTVTKAKQGSSGTNGANGSNGIRGSVTTSLSIPGGAFDQYAAYNAVNALAGTPVVGDIVTEYNSGTFVESRYYAGGGNPGTWNPWSTKIDGNLLVTGTVGAAALSTNQVWSKQIKIATTGGANNWIASENFNAGTTGFKIDGTGNAEFYNVKVRGDVLLGGGNLIASSVGTQFVYNSTEYTYTQSGSGGYLTNAYYWPTNYGSFRIYQPYNTSPGDQRLFFNRPGGGHFPVTPGQWYQASAYSAVYGCSVQIFIDWFDSAGNYILYQSPYGTSNSTKGGDWTLSDTTWQKISVAAQAPSNAAYATLGFYKPQGDYWTTNYADVTQINFTPTPANYTPIIPWSPGGISLMDTLSLKANSTYTIDSAVWAWMSSGNSDWRNNFFYVNPAASTPSIIGDLPLTTQDVATTRFVFVSFTLRAQSATVGRLTANAIVKDTVNGGQDIGHNFIIDTQSVASAFDRTVSYTMLRTFTIPANTSKSLALSFTTSASSPVWGAYPEISNIYITCFTNKR